MMNGNEWLNNSTLAYYEDYSYDGNGNILNLNRKDAAENAIDNLSYNYQSGTNKLTHIGDFVADNAFTYDIDNQSANNYTYDAIGNLTKDVKGGLDEISWTPYGKIAEIKKDAANNSYRLVYDYDAMGNRVRKSYYNTSVKNEYDGTWYVRDASGNIMATYTLHSYNGITPEVKLQSYELYGSSRLGSLNLGLAVEGDYNLTATTNYTRLLGLKQYEISNHLGNVLTTFSDQRVFAPTGMSSTNSNALIAKLISAQDYYPFGMIMDGRSWNTDKVKFGFNGKENDNEVMGDGNWQDYGMRMYNPRIGRFPNVDPLTKQYPELTPYQFASNTPVRFIDLDGKEGASPWAMRNCMGDEAYERWSKGTAIGTIMSYTAVVDMLFTKGRLSLAVGSYFLGDMLGESERAYNARNRGDISTYNEASENSLNSTINVGVSFALAGAFKGFNMFKSSKGISLGEPSFTKTQAPKPELFENDDILYSEIKKTFPRKTIDFSTGKRLEGGTSFPKIKLDFSKKYNPFYNQNSPSNLDILSPMPNYIGLNTLQKVSIGIFSTSLGVFENTISNTPSPDFSITKSTISFDKAKSKPTIGF